MFVERQIFFAYDESKDPKNVSDLCKFTLIGLCDDDEKAYLVCLCFNQLSNHKKHNNPYCLELHYVYWMQSPDIALFKLFAKYIISLIFSPCNVSNVALFYIYIFKLFKCI